MVEKQDIRVYVNAHPRFAAAGQLERLQTLGGEIYVESRSGNVIDSVINSVRKELRSVVAVDELFLLAPADGTSRKRKTELADRIDRIKDRGGIVMERSSGAISNKPGFAKAFLRATEMIANGGRGRAGQHRQGRPAREFTKEQLDAMGRIWSSRKYPTRRDATAAVQALGIHITTPGLYRLFGTPERGAEPIEKVKPNKPRRKRCYVYFIKNGNVVKIGRSEAPYKRMKDMEVANHANLEMLALVDGGLKREKSLHKRFQKHHIRGEWFTLDPAILRYIKSVKKSGRKS